MTRPEESQRVNFVFRCLPRFSFLFFNFFFLISGSILCVLRDLCVKSFSSAVFFDLASIFPFLFSPFCARLFRGLQFFPQALRAQTPFRIRRHGAVRQFRAPAIPLGVAGHRLVAARAARIHDSDYRSNLISS
jgi:hypothetical protein